MTSKEALTVKTSLHITANMLDMTNNTQFPMGSADLNSTTESSEEAIDDSKWMIQSAIYATIGVVSTFFLSRIDFIDYDLRTCTSCQRLGIQVIILL